MLIFANNFVFKDAPICWIIDKEHFVLLSLKSEIFVFDWFFHNLKIFKFSIDLVIELKLVKKNNFNLSLI